MEDTHQIWKDNTVKDTSNGTTEMGKPRNGTKKIQRGGPFH